jgi:acetyltransferase-like isoleucine patch superfamily enzyme
MLCKKRKYRKYEIGYGSYGDLRVVFENSRARLFIGRFCAIGDGVTVFLGEGEHRTNWLTTYDNIIFDPFDPPATKGDVRIGSDVWMCTDAAILSGVNIGNGAIIGAKAVVAKDVPPYAIVVGNPARVVSYRFDERTISILERIAWWDWPLEKIEEAWPLLSSDKVDAFIERYGPDQNMSGPSR